jgi:2-polyprenyl-3-methyl-5-hydroxy-6-metoxy-1,4-benzoquinol methylase
MWRVLLTFSQGDRRHQNMADFHEIMYDRQSQAFAKDLVDPDRKKIAASWFDPNTADSWRHARSYEIARHLNTVPGARWLTVGDGRFGLDSINLKRRGVEHVLATDLSETLMRSAKEEGYLSEYRIENAEKLSFRDGEFDYVFCKEAYHHFPRPAIALYEMLRVSRSAVIVIEPNDRERSPLRRLARVIGGRAPAETYEEDGNYVYSISERELTKAALGINLPQVAFKRLNDAWTPNLWAEVADYSSFAYKKMRLKILLRDFLCWLGLDHHMLLMACLFRVSLSPDQRNRMESDGWRVVDLPRNPYL